MAEKKENGIGRRDLIKGLATVPVLGAIWYGSLQKKAYDAGIRESILDELKVKMVEPPKSGTMAGDPIRLGIIGFGIRGSQLVRAAGFATPSWKEKMKEGAMKNSKDTRLKDYLEQDSLNIRFTAVCDLFDVRAEDAMAAVTTPENEPKRYRHYQDLLASDDVDGVIIATPDHWHAQMAIDAAKAGKHVYVEKCMTRTIPETFALREAVKESGITFQLGHQHRQTESFLTAQDIINKNVLGPISLIQTSTNRNSDNGAWQYNIHEKASPQTIDWDQFLGNAPKIPYNAEHFFRWRKWFEYGTGLSGDLLTHEFDSINTILKMGIPSSVTATGGVYTHKDGRHVPDVFQVAMEYPNYGEGMTFLYSATLGNQYHRTNVLMGHDGTMELGKNLTVYADTRSTRYKDMMKEGIVTPDLPLYSYRPGNKGVDGVTSATAKYFAAKGLLYTYRDGKKVDSTHLHIREWLSCIRHGGQPSCHIDNGFEEAISAHMATLSYKTGRRIEWDQATESIVDPNEEIKDETLRG